MPSGISQKIQMVLKLNRAHLLQVSADDVDLQGDNIDTIKKNAGTIIDARKEVDLELNAEKNNYKYVYGCRGKS
jgi:plasmid rolling circle replication initiator protein Rep